MTYLGVYLKELGVNLKLRYGASLLLGGLAAFLNALEEVVDGARDDTQLLIWDVDVKACSHGVCLPWSRLDAGEKMSYKKEKKSIVNDMKYQGDHACTLTGKVLGVRLHMWEAFYCSTGFSFVRLCQGRRMHGMKYRKVDLFKTTDGEFYRKAMLNAYLKIDILELTW